MARVALCRDASPFGGAPTIGRMTDFFFVEPEVPGGLGERTELLRRPDGQPVVQRLHFEFGDGSFGDDLIECHPVFMVTDALGAALRAADLTGFALSGDLEVTADDNVLELKPAWQPPSLLWLQVTGTPGVDDVSLAPDGRLLVSDRVVDVLRQFQIDGCDITPDVA